MNTIHKAFALLALMAITLFACSPNEYELGSSTVAPEDLVEGIAFKIEHDSENPNIVYLISTMGAQYTPLWNHPQGRSQAEKVTLKIPFAGTYEVQFGVQTRAGIVYGEKVRFQVDDMYAGFISDEMWSMIAGGAGQSKTWYLDLDAQATTRYFNSPKYFFTSSYIWDNLHNAAGENYYDADPWVANKAITPNLKPDGTAMWYWLADYKGNGWLCKQADFGSMTFDLKDGAHLVVDQAAYGLGIHNGSYMVDTEKHTIKVTDARIIHDSGFASADVDWSSIRILYLTKDAMQLGIVPNKESESMTVYNYISKEYKDKWVPAETVAPEPPYKGDANADLTTSNSTTKKWKLSLASPYNWAGLSGLLLNKWSSPADYATSGWAPYDETLVRNISLTMTKTSDSEGTYLITDGASNQIKGSYVIDAKHNINFNQSISFSVSGFISFETTAKNELRLLSTEVDALGKVIGMWLGQRSVDKEEYMAYHFEPTGL